MRYKDKELMEEMTALGLSDVHMSPADGAVFGTIPANTGTAKKPERQGSPLPPADKSTVDS